MRLPRLPLQRMFLIPILRVIMSRLPTRRTMLLNMLRMPLHILPIHILQRIQRQFNIRNQGITPRAGEIFSYNDPHQLEFLAVRRHGVRWHYPAPFTEVVSDGEFIVVVFGFWIEAECYEGEAGAAALAHDDEAELFEVGG